MTLTRDPIPALTWRIALPMSIGLFFNTMFNVVDTFCAGWLGTEALAALSISFPLYFILMACGSGIAQGTTALLAHALGADDKDEARRVFAQALVFTLAAAIGLSVAGLLSAPWMFRQLGASGDYLDRALAYMNVILIGGGFVLLPMIFNAALASRGDTLPFRNFLIAGFLANLLLNPMLIWGWLGLPAMGIGGIALATIIVQLGGCLYLAGRVRRLRTYRGLHARELVPDPAVLRRIARQAIPAALNMLTIALGIFVTTWFVKHFGQDAVAALGIATRIEQIVLMPAIGLNFAVLSLVGQNHGAGHRERVREAWLTNLRYGFVMMVVGGGIVALLRGQAMQLFSDDPAVIGHGRDYLLAASLTLAAYPLLFVTVFALQGIQRPGYGLWIGLYRQLVAPVAVIHLLAFTLGWGTWGVWWGLCGVTWSAALVSVAYGWRRLATPVVPVPVTQA